MGELIDLDSRRGKSKKIATRAPLPQSVVTYAKHHIQELIKVTVDSLSTETTIFKINPRSTPNLNFGYVNNPHGVNFIGIMPSDVSSDINVAVTDSFSLPIAGLGQDSDRINPDAEALYAVAYGLAVHAASSVRRPISKGYDEQLWGRTNTPTERLALPHRAAGMVVAQHYYFDQEEVLAKIKNQFMTVPEHYAALQNPLDLTQTKQVYTHLA